MVQEFFETGMYVVDKNFKIVNVNDTMAQLYPEVHVGDICYKAIALQESQCGICPLKTNNALFYNPIRKEWINANAATMDYPGHGACYTVQFQLRQSVSQAGQEQLQTGNMEEHILALSGGNADVCAIAGYCAPGSPLSYANRQLVELLGYDSVLDLSNDIDGLVFNTIHPDDVGRVTVDLTNCAQNGGRFETSYRIRRKDHTWFSIVARGTRVENMDGSFSLLCVITDMTEFIRQQAELWAKNEELVRKELASQAVLERMPGGYHRCAAAPGWPFLYFGSSFEAVTGWSKEEIETRFDNRFINMVLPEDLPLCAGIVEDVEKNGYSNAVYRLKKKGGGYTWVSDSTMKVTLNDDCFYQGTIADITDHIEALEKARTDAEASNQAKSAFLFNASHDIRTPMNAIQGFAHIIEQNADDAKIVSETVKKLQSAGEVLLTLLNDVLELSRIERGKEQVNRHPLDMLAHADKLYEMMYQDMAANGISFHMENSIAHRYVMADDLKLTRVAMNLLSNAKKFTPAGGTVTFGIVESNHIGNKATYNLFVQDTGIGMSQAFQQRAFEQFERERTSTASGVTGSGLGLSITKKIIDLVGGTISIESALGKGTRITCSVPLTLTDRISIQPRMTLEQADFTGRRLLLVEDNDFNREIGAYVFQNMGFTVEQAVNGQDCLDKLTAAPAGHFDLVLMDIQMPVMDGYDATRCIRSQRDPVLAAVPIVAMTANAFDEDRKKCMDVGMDGHISKPLQAEEALEELTRILSR